VSDEAKAEGAAEDGGKKKKDKKAKKAAPAGNVLSIRSHPRAARSVRRTRARAGIASFFLVLLLSLAAHVPAFDAVVRALLAGIAMNLIAWWLAMALWRQLIIGELRALHVKRVEQREAAVAAAEAAAAAAAA
jgi:hypothetical protein